MTLSVLLLLENNKTQISPNFTENFQDSSRTEQMIDENSSTVIVNIHGLLGEQDCIQMDFEEELLVEEEQFIIDNVAYEIVRVIKEDVEYPVVYVVILDILSHT